MNNTTMYIPYNNVYTESEVYIVFDNINNIRGVFKNYNDAVFYLQHYLYNMGKIESHKIILK